MKKLALLAFLSGCRHPSSDMVITTDHGSHFKSHLFSDQSIVNVTLHPNGKVWTCYEPTGDTGDFYCGYLIKQREQ